MKELPVALVGMGLPRIRRRAPWLGPLLLLFASSGCSEGSDEERAGSALRELLDDGAATTVGTVSGGTSEGNPDPRACEDCSTIPLAFWTFDDCNRQTTQLSDSAYSSGTAHPAFRAVSTACDEGKKHYSLRFSQAEDVAYSPDQPDYDFGQGLTIAAWIRPDSVRDTQSIARKRLDATSSFVVAIEHRQLRVALRLANGHQIGVAAPIQASRYTHFAATYDNQLLLLYLDGKLVSQERGNGPVASGVGPIYIGNDANGRRFRGAIDEVWLNVLAAPEATIRELNCMHQSPTLTLLPAENPPVTAGMPVSFDLAITNVNGSEFCSPEYFEYFVSDLPYPLQADSYSAQVLVAPGETTHVPLQIVAQDVGTGGTFPFEYFVASSADWTLQATAQANFALQAPVPPTPTGCPATPSQPVAPGGYYVNGNTICKEEGNGHLFHGVARPSLEWMPAGEHLSPEDFSLIASWNANVVRLALNQDFWLAASPQYDPSYAANIDQAIGWAEAAGMDVILDLHWSDAGTLGSCVSTPTTTCQQLMADANSVTFWSEVAARYKNDGRVAFELYNEPHEIDWEVWRNGGRLPQGWTAVGMQQLYEAVRTTGAQNLVLIAGTDWAYDLSRVPEYRIDGYNIVYVSHVYGPYRPMEDWHRGWASLATTDPVIITEFGASNCATDTSQQLIQYADTNHVSWTSWAWYPGGCGFPALIEDWAGTPSAAGAVVKAALLGYGSSSAGSR